MNPNHLIIGLGGTGGKIIRAYRKAIYQEFRKDAPDNANIGYLYVDSSTEMMSIDDPSWKILGTSVQLNKKSQLLIQEASLAARLENLNNFPGIKPWIGSPDQWKDILGSIIGVTLGGQKRRLGRFLFACKSTDYRDQVQALVRSLQSTGTTETTFHVCTGLAGGTGSGSVVDAVAQLRDLYSDSNRYRIIVYALLPEAHPNPSWDTGNYHANGYAALMELNALSVGRYEPFDVTGTKGRLKLVDPFNGCYLFTNENENGLTVDVDKEIPAIMADFLYQKTIAVRNIAWPTLGRMENAENGDGRPEMSPTNNIPERSKRFLTFGIKRLAIPEEEIAEYLSYSFARQAALQLRFNNWTDSNGFTDEPKNQDFHEFVKQKENQANWAISDDHLMLSTGILPEDANNKKWVPIDTEWLDVMPNFKSLVREQRREVWLDELAKLCQKRFDQDYRGLGVRTFYRTKLKAKKEHANEIRRRIEAELFDDWRKGVRSVNDIANLLGALLDSLHDRLPVIDERLTQVKDGEEQAGGRVQANSREWAKMGFISKTMLRRPDSLLDTQADALLQLYIYRTKIEALLFAKQLTEETLAALTGLKGEIDRCASTINEGIKQYNDRIRSRLTDDGVKDLRQQLVRFYKPDIVRSVTQMLVKDQKQQETNANAVRMALIRKLGESPGFGVFNERFTIYEFLDVLDKECVENARTAHNNLVQNRKDKLLGVSIIEKLKERYGGDAQDLKTFITELVARAGNYISFETSERFKSGPGIPAGVQTAVARLSIVMPAAKEEADFAGRLRAVFLGAKATEVEIVEIDSQQKQNEIVIISLANLFPLRYLSQTSFLRGKFEQRVNGPNAARARLEILGEGDGSQFPNLFVPIQDEVVRGAMPYLLLAQAMGLVQETRSPQTGAASRIFVAKDENGFDTDPIPLGKTTTESLKELDIRGADTIRFYVNEALKRGEFATEAKRAELQKSIVGEVESIKAERGNNMQDEVYKRFLDAGKEAVGILKRET